MAHLTFICLLCCLPMLKISAAISEIVSSETHVHSLPYWIQDSLLEYANEIRGRNLTGPIRKIYRKDLNASYVAYYEFEFENWFMTFSAGPKTRDHRLVEEGQVPRTTETLIDRATKLNKVCHKFFRLNADGTTICEDVTGQAVASTMDLETLTAHVNTTNLPKDIGKSLKDFEEEWKKLAKEIHSSLEWKEMSVNSLNKSTSVNQRKIIYKVLKVGEWQDVALGALDVSKVEIKVHLETTSSNSKKMFCLLLDNICSEEGKPGEVNVSRILRKKSNLVNLSYITMVVTDDYETFLTQLKAKSIDFHLKLTVAGKFVAIRHYTISLSHKRNKRSSWSGFTEFSIPYENLMPDYDQHICCGGCYSGCTPVAWAQIFAYYDRVAHAKGYRYSTSLWSGIYGASGSSSYRAPEYFNRQVRKYVEALRVPLGTFCSGNGGATPSKNNPKIDTWFRQRQGSGRVLTLSRNIYQQVSHYIKRGYPVMNNIWYRGSSEEKSAHSVVVTKIKERSRQYKSCRKVGWWWGRKTKCYWKTVYEYEWYRKMGWGGSQNKWYPPSVLTSAYGAFVATV